MTIQSRAALKSVFETGDIPIGTDYSNLIDSCANLADTGEQDFSGKIYTPELITSHVSAGTISAASFSVGTASYTNIQTTNLLAAIASASSLYADSAYFTTVTSTNINCVSAQAVTFVANDIRIVSSILSAAGTTQGAAAQISSNFTRVQGVTDGSATGVKLQADGQPGRVSYVVNETAVSANLWPPTSGTINALSANAAFAMAAKTAYTVLCPASGAYYVK